MPCAAGFRRNLLPLAAFLGGAAFLGARLVGLARLGGDAVGSLGGLSTNLGAGGGDCLWDGGLGADGLRTSISFGELSLRPRAESSLV